MASSYYYWQNMQYVYLRIYARMIPTMFCFMALKFIYNFNNCKAEFCSLFMPADQAPHSIGVHSRVLINLIVTCQATNISKTHGIRIYSMHDASIAIIARLIVQKFELFMKESSPPQNT